MHRRREDHSCGTLTARAVIHLAFNVSNLVGFRVVREEIEIFPSCKLPELHTSTVVHSFLQELGLNQLQVDLL